MGSHFGRATEIRFPSLYPFRFICPVSNSIQCARKNDVAQAREATNQCLDPIAGVVHLLLFLSVSVAHRGMHS
jgi:hypothetical protein